MFKYLTVFIVSLLISGCAMTYDSAKKQTKIEVKLSAEDIAVLVLHSAFKKRGVKTNAVYENDQYIFKITE